ncbi:MAG: hypothetical protein GF353_19095 [Candidatus Lokiarchaeota archaeon]|nr:hypothetical protein [Candidatus Lokiarchaeota archaeon]
MNRSRRKKMLKFDVKKEIQLRKVSDIILEEEFYARFEPDQNLINQYEENIEAILLNKNGGLIQISENNILIDGYHRLKAIERVHGKDYEFDCLVHLTDNTDYIELESYAANPKHGKRNSKKEIIRNIQRLYAKGHSQETIMQRLSIAKSIFYEATKKQREGDKEELERRAIEMYLRAWNTQKSIANELGVSEGYINKILTNSTNGKYEDKFWNLSIEDSNYSKCKPFRYNIWNLDKTDKETSHFGHFPVVFMENVLLYHTDPLDIIFDPFAGDGITIDACKSMFRRYYCSDRIVKPGREKDIKEWDVINGLPDDLPKPRLAFLDPPYWKQAENKYSDSENDLGNMSLADFNGAMNKLLDALKSRKVEYIAVVIRPTQYENDFVFVDHIFDFHDMIKDQYEIEMRYILPDSKQQYLPQMVEKAREKNVCLVLNRDLVVWKLDKN